MLSAAELTCLLAALATQLAVRRPRIVLTEVGRSFELFAEYLRAWGLTVRRATLAPGEDVRVCIKTNSLIYMSMKPASSRFLADQAGLQPASQKFFLKNQ